MKFNVIEDHIIWTDVGYGNSVAINLGEKVYIVDSMVNWKLAAEWRHTVQEYYEKPISGLILTHHHPDHVFGNQIFADIPIIANSDIRTMMMGFEKHYWKNIDTEELDEWEKEGYGVKNFQFTQASICFETKLQLYGPKPLELVQADGHTNGSTYLWQPDTKTLIAGDLVFNREGPYGADESCNILTWQKVIETLIELKPAIIVSGHGPTATVKDLTEINEFFLRSIEFIRKKLEQGVKSKEIEDDPDFPDYYYSDRPERRKRSIDHWTRFLQKYS